MQVGLLQKGLRMKHYSRGLFPVGHPLRPQQVTLGYLLIQITCLLSPVLAKTTETCATEEFSAKCPMDAVIVMTSARYGRMNIGKCVKEDLGRQLGCGNDVSAAMDIMCSGRTDCVVRVPDPLLESGRGCNAELKSYLEASYTCYNVVAPMNPCSDHTPIRLMKPEGYLASVVASRTGCGFQSASWILEAKPGQRIEISFVEFNTSEAQLNIGGTELDCKERAYLMDKYAGRKIKICPRRTRVSSVYVSVNNSLDVTISSQSVNEGNHFLIHYQFIGCPDRPATPGTRFHRTGTSTATVSCIDSDQAFDLVCSEGQWEGEIENCTVPGLVQQEEPSKKSAISGMLLVVLIAVSFILLCIIAAIFVFCVKRLRRNGSHLHHHRCDTHESVYIKNDSQYRQGTLKQLHVEMEPCDYDMANRTMRYKEAPHGIIHNQIATGQECLLCGEQSRDQSTEDMINAQPAYIPQSHPRQVHSKPPSAKESNIENENRLRQQQLQKENDRSNTQSIYGYAKHKQIDNSCPTSTITAMTPKQVNQSFDIDSSTLYPRNYAMTQMAKKSKEAVYVAPPCVDLLNNTL